MTRRGNVFTVPNGKEDLRIISIGELLSTKNESWKKCKRSWKSPGIWFSYFCANPEIDLTPLK